MVSRCGVSVPGKVFLVGEYAVLDGMSAWVTAISPRFTFSRGASPNIEFPTESPAGRYLARQGISQLAGRFSDPWEGRGGFGGSTAEFAITAYLDGVRDPLVAWRAYRELHPDSAPGRRPSGADLISQWVGGTVEWNPRSESFRRIDDLLERLPILLFSATHLPNRKTVTHAHLATQNLGTKFDSLLPSLARAHAGAEAGDWAEVGGAFSAYADSLAHLGLEPPVVRNERLALARLPGVLGAKGCGSLQTDAMIVVLGSLAGPPASHVIEFAERSCGLRLIARGLTRETGIREEVG